MCTSDLGESWIKLMISVTGMEDRGEVEAPRHIFAALGPVIWVSGICCWEGTGNVKRILNSMSADLM